MLSFDHRPARQDGRLSDSKLAAGHAHIPQQSRGSTLFHLSDLAASGDLDCALVFIGTIRACMHLTSALRDTSHEHPTRHGTYVTRLICDIRVPAMLRFRISVL